MNKITRLEIILHDDEAMEAYTKSLRKTLYLMPGDSLVFNARFDCTPDGTKLEECDLYPVDRFWSIFRKYEHHLFKLVAMYESVPLILRRFIPNGIREEIEKFKEEKENEIN